MSEPLGQSSDRARATPSSPPRWTILELGELETRAEATAGTVNTTTRQVVPLDRIEDVVQRIHEGERESVEAIRPVQGDQRDLGAWPLEQDEGTVGVGVRHGRPLPGARSRSRRGRRPAG